MTHIQQLDLVDLTQDERERYYGWLVDPEVTRYLECRFQQNSPKNIEEYIRHCQETGFIFGIFVPEYVGNIRLTINWIHRFAEVGIMIGDKKEWGKGIGSEAIRLVSEFATKLGLHKLTAGAYAANPASIRAFEKAGFIREGLLKSQYMIEHGEYTDEIMLGKLLTSDVGTNLIKSMSESMYK